MNKENEKKKRTAKEDKGIKEVKIDKKPKSKPKRIEKPILLEEDKVKEETVAVIPVKEEIIQEVIVNTKDEEQEQPKSSFNLTEVIVIMVITALFGAFIGGVVVYLRDDNTCPKCTSIRKDLDELVSTYDKITSEYYEDLNKTALVEAGIKGMIDYLGDPYSRYMSLDEATNFNEELDGKFVGMGAMITVNGEGKIYISSLFNNSPATRSGMKVNDIIAKVDGTSTDGLTVTQVSSMIKSGAVGTKVKVEVIRDGQTLEVEITRGEVEIDSVHGEVIERNNKKVGLLTIDRFAANTYEQFEKAYTDLKDKGVDSLLVDVRYNTGGHLNVVEKIASMFLSKDAVVYGLNTKGTITKIAAKQDKKITLPVAMLVNGGSASASEILAAALKENLNIQIIGTNTYGKGTVQKLVTLESGATVKYTIQKWLTPKGNEIDKVGVAPTIVVEEDDKYKENPIRENDNQLNVAIETLTK